MRFTFTLFLAFFGAGCAMQPQLPQRSLSTATPEVVVAARPTKLVETRYDVGAYREAAAPAIWHEAHAIYRRTRVPIASDDLETAPRASFSTASFAPLPAIEELKAELATQKKITAELNAMQASLTEVEQKMKAQYSALVNQSVELMKVREQLDADRSRSRRAAPIETAPILPAAPTAVATPSAEVKW